MKLLTIFLLFILTDITFGHACIFSYSSEYTPFFDKINIRTVSYETDIIATPSIWEIGWAYPIEALIFGLFIWITTHYRLMRNEKQFSEEKLGIFLNIIHKTHTPLALIQNLLEDVAESDIPESASKEIRRILKHVSHVIDRYANIIILEKMKEKRETKSRIVECELFTYITSITDQCKVHANTYQIQLNINKNFSYISCWIDEITLTAALQCLFEKIIDSTPQKGYVNILISLFTDHWSLQISNGPNNKNPKRFQQLISLVKNPCYGNLRFIRKIIQTHGGKMKKINRGQSVTFQIIIPLDCRTDSSTTWNVSRTYDENKAIATDLSPNSKKSPHILLIMSDKELSNYFHKTLSDLYQLTILENPDQITVFFNRQDSDIIIIDEIVKDRYGVSLCSMIKSDANIFNIPVILLTSSYKDESYLAHICCEADKLELRMVNICRLKADIQMLINHHIAQRERLKQFIIKNQSINLPKTNAKNDENIRFMEKVEKFLEKNISENTYTVDMLCSDMCMSHTKFYNKIKENTGECPKKYMVTFKMEKAQILLITQQYSITEVASLLGFCDAKYFGKEFKKHFHYSPTDYVKNILG